jgi:hypothetical protein
MFKTIKMLFASKKEKLTVIDPVDDAIEKYKKYKEDTPERTKRQEEERRENRELYRKRIRGFIEKLNGNEKTKHLLAASERSIVLFREEYDYTIHTERGSSYPNNRTIFVRMTKDGVTASPHYCLCLQLGGSYRSEIFPLTVKQEEELLKASEPITEHSTVIIDLKQTSDVEEIHG